MKVTISDVARLAGVSTATVSHTINNTRYVSEETKENVYQAIAELGYTPDASARSFRTGKKRTIGFIVPDISNKFFGTIIEAVENYLSTRGYHLIIANTKEDATREETNIRLLSAGLVDGLLVAGLGVSAHRDAMPVLRMQPDVQNVGYAAGLAVTPSALTIMR
jgi:LacI family transcriptional regulator